MDLLTLVLSVKLLVELPLYWLLLVLWGYPTPFNCSPPRSPLFLEMPFVTNFSMHGFKYSQGPRAESGRSESSWTASLPDRASHITEPHLDEETSTFPQTPHSSPMSGPCSSRGFSWLTSPRMEPQLMSKLEWGSRSPLFLIQEA